MRPHLDESDADGQQDARIADFGAPERHETARPSLDQIFGVNEQPPQSEAAAEADAHARLADFFARTQAAPRQPDPAVDAVFLTPSVATTLFATPSAAPGEWRYQGQGVSAAPPTRTR